MRLLNFLFSLIYFVGCSSQSVVLSPPANICDGVLKRDRLNSDTHECYPAPFGVAYRQDTSAGARFLFENLLGKNQNRKRIAQGLLLEHSIRFQHSTYLPLEVVEGQPFLLHYDPNHPKTLLLLYTQVIEKWTPEQRAAIRFSERPPAKTIPMYHLSDVLGYDTGEIAWSGADLEIGALLKPRAR